MMDFDMVLGNVMLYSDSLGVLVYRDFIYNGTRYVWNDNDCLYYSELTDEDFIDLMIE